MFKKPKVRRSQRHIPEGFQFLLEGQPHPLLIPSIIEEVTSYLPYQDLKVFRQVCRGWDEEAKKKLSKLTKIVLTDDDRIAQFTKLFQNIPKSVMPKNFELRGDVDLGSSKVRKLFQVFGEPMEFVYFNRVRWTDSELKNILFKMLPNITTLAVEARAYSDRRLFVNDEFDVLPQVKELKLNVFSFITELTTPFLRDILRACPNLEKISSIKNEKRHPLPMQFIQYVCKEMSFDTADDVVNMPYAADIAIAEALIDIKHITLPKLSILDCNMRLRGHAFQQLGQKEFPLKQLDLTLLADVEPTVLRNVLSGLENTLEVIKLKYHPRCPSALALQGIPPLKNLSKLTLNGYRASLRFLESLPSLKHLTLMRLDFTRAINSEVICLKFKSKMQSLEIHGDLGKRCGSSTIHSVIKLFPYLKRLRLENLTDEGIKAVFKGYPELTRLEAIHGLYTDVGVTGLSVPELREYENEDGLEDVENDGHHPLNLKVGAGIQSLKNLRNLLLASPKLTDLAIVLGVMKCESLRQVQLVSSHITDISITKMLDHLDLFYLKTQHGYKISKDTVDYAKQKMKGRQVSINEYEGPFKQSQIPEFMRRNGSLSVRVSRLMLKSPSTASEDDDDTDTSFSSSSSSSSSSS